MFGLTEFYVNEDELEQLSDVELARLEDRLRLEQELDVRKGAQFTAGRVIVFVLSALGIALALMVLSRALPTERLGPLNIPLYLMAIGAGIGLGHGAWYLAGYAVRNAVRWVLGHWPVVLFILVGLVRLSGG